MSSILDNIFELSIYGNLNLIYKYICILLNLNAFHIFDMEIHVSYINDLLHVIQQSKCVFFSHSITEMLRQTLTSLSMVIYHALQKLP